MSIKELTIQQLYARLSDGWSAEHAEVPREIATRLFHRLSVTGEEGRAIHSGYYGTMALNRVRFLGAANTAYLVLGGDAGSDVPGILAQFWREKGGAGRFALVLTPNAESKQIVLTTAPRERCVVLDADEGQELLHNSHHPLEFLKERIRAHIPLRRLVPYDITRPVAPNMFFGRRDLVKRLLHEETTSFAIAGPGRIGKSSMLHQIHRELRARLEDARRDRLFLIDCYPYWKLEPDDLARRLALDIAADAEANRTSTLTLLRFLRRQSDEGEQPLELLFDEVDYVCENPAFHEVGEAVKHGYCRVILCGKGGLLRMMSLHERPFAHRLELIQPEPLDTDAARHLLLDPLFDLGIQAQDADELCDLVFGLTQRRPHLIQACAKRLIGIALAENTRQIGRTQVEQVVANFGVLAINVLPLEDMADEYSQLASLLLLREGVGETNVGKLQELFEPLGFDLSAAKALEICHDLWICNVLIRERGIFALQNEHLVAYARRMNLGREIDRLRTKLGQKQRVSV